LRIGIGGLQKGNEKGARDLKGGKGTIKGKFWQEANTSHLGTVGDIRKKRGGKKVFYGTFKKRGFRGKLPQRVKKEKLRSGKGKKPWLRGQPCGETNPQEENGKRGA